jgi:ComF family protein
MLSVLKDFFFPRTCAVCGKLEEDLCVGCEKELGISAQICPMCEQESIMGWTHEKCKRDLGMDGLIVLFEYGDPSVRAVVDTIKYGFNKDLVIRLFANMNIETGVNFDYLVPVPLHFYRQNWRGFNQAQEIGRVLSEKIEVPCINALKRVKNTKQQALMKSREERIENIRDAFCVKTKKNKNSKTLNDEDLDLRGKNVLLVDDVFTTGSNMKECCKVLKKAGVEIVWGFALGH